MTWMLRKAGVAALLVLFTFAVGCGGGDGNNYPQQVQDNFMNSCTETGGSQSQCRCALDELEDEYTLEEFIALEESATALDDIPGLDSIILKCLGD